MHTFTQPVIPEGTSEDRMARFEVMNLSSTPLRKDMVNERSKCVRLCVGSRHQRSYWKWTDLMKDHARGPVQLELSGSSLRIEFCVVYFIGRSPTQLVLCHKSIEKSKSIE
jgi:hypothetical protein